MKKFMKAIRNGITLMKLYRECRKEGFATISYRCTDKGLEVQRVFKDGKGWNRLREVWYYEMDEATGCLGESDYVVRGVASITDAVFG